MLLPRLSNWFLYLPTINQNRDNQLLLGLLKVSLHHSTSQPSNVFFFFRLFCKEAELAGHDWLKTNSQFRDQHPKKPQSYYAKGFQSQCFLTRIAEACSGWREPHWKSANVTPDAQGSTKEPCRTNTIWEESKHIGIIYKAFPHIQHSNTKLMSWGLQGGFGFPIHGLIFLFTSYIWALKNGAFYIEPEKPQLISVF